MTQSHLTLTSSLSLLHFHIHTHAHLYTLRFLPSYVLLRVLTDLSLQACHLSHVTHFFIQEKRVQSVSFTFYPYAHFTF